MNALGIARRELDPSNTVLLEEERLAELAALIRRGADAVLLDELKAHVAEKLRISNPAYLEKYE